MGGAELKSWTLSWDKETICHPSLGPSLTAPALVSLVECFPQLPAVKRLHTCHCIPYGKQLTTPCVTSQLGCWVCKGVEAWPCLLSPPCPPLGFPVSWEEYVPLRGGTGFSVVLVQATRAEFLVRSPILSTQLRASQIWSWLNTTDLILASFLMVSQGGRIRPYMIRRTPMELINSIGDKSIKEIKIWENSEKQLDFGETQSN